MIMYVTVRKATAIVGPIQIPRMPKSYLKTKTRVDGIPIKK